MSETYDDGVPDKEGTELGEPWYKDRTDPLDS
jgi:hypothetical protein